MGCGANGTGRGSGATTCFGRMGTARGLTLGTAERAGFVEVGDWLAVLGWVEVEVGRVGAGAAVEVGVRVGVGVCVGVVEDVEPGAETGCEVDGAWRAFGEDGVGAVTFSGFAVVSRTGVDVGVMGGCNGRRSSTLTEVMATLSGGPGCVWRGQPVDRMISEAEVGNAVVCDGLSARWTTCDGRWHRERESATERWRSR